MFRRLPFRGALARLYDALPLGLALAARRLFRRLESGFAPLAAPRSATDGGTVAPMPLQAEDVLLNIGTSWFNDWYAPLVAALQREVGFRYVVMMYDLIPWKLPALLPRQTQQAFQRWLQVTLPVTQCVLAISECTRRDLRDFINEAGLRKVPANVVRLGQDPVAPASQGSALPSTRLPTPPFVLTVGTLELRKNHRLLFDVWQRLLERHGPESVPTMVWAGRRNWWYMDSLMREVERSRHLDGKLMILGDGDAPGASDAELDWLYRSCLFTLFPSRYEGWGLPVAESLAYGKVCIASNAASIPEVAGDLIDYHDPDDVAQCYRLVKRAILQPVWLQEQEARIRKRFRPDTWGACAAAVISACMQSDRAQAKSAE
jgi:glycosyltransferase involved in cell wall biosynthesis